MSSRRGIDHLGKPVNDLNLESTEDGSWHSVSKKHKNKAVKPPPNQRPLQQAPAPKAWGQPDTAKRVVMSNNASGSAINNSRHGMRPHTGSSQANLAVEADDEEEDKVSDDDDDEESLSDDDDDDIFGNDSDESLSHDSKKQHKKLKAFFDAFDKLTVEEVSDTARRRHCPACQGGCGATEWYYGLPPLVTHARSKESVRMKLHRTFADLLDEELRRRGMSVVPAGEAFGKWEGLRIDDDRQIVWPPMVMIMNTLLEQDDDQKWLGMGNPELLEYFKEYEPVRAKHSYGPKGHRGIGVLIFDGSAMGYFEADCLDRHFLRQGTGRSGWEKPQNMLFAGGKRLLYGFLARHDDIEDFNRHCQVKMRLKYDMRSYKEKVVDQLRKMSEDSQLVTWLMSQRAKDKALNKLLEEYVTILSKRVRKTDEEIRIVRDRTKAMHEENKEEMDFQERFYNDQFQMIPDATNANENQFEKKDSRRLRAEEVGKFKEFQ